jgi:DNA invertase Pin-like site-specific DNA recombinase
MAKAYSLLRYSRSDPDARDRRSTMVAAYCKSHDLELDADLWWQTGRSAGRHELLPDTATILRTFLERVKTGEVRKGSSLLLDTLDTRSRAAAIEASELLGRIVDLGTTVVTLADGSACTRRTLKADPAALLYAVIGLMRARDETALRSRTVRESWETRRARARHKEPISAVCPAWLRLDSRTGTFAVDRERARIVQRIYREALRGVGHAQIAESFDREGVRAFGRGKRWHRSYILKLLRNPAVLGTYVPHTVESHDGRRVRKATGNAIRHYYPPIVEPEVFLQVQTLVGESRSPLRGRHAKGGVVGNVFGGLAHCGRCGASVTMVSKGTAAKRVKYLVCSAARVHLGCRQYEAIRYDRFEGALLRNRDLLFENMPAAERRADLDRLIVEAEAAAYAIGDEIERASVPVDGGRRPAAGHAHLRTLKSEHEKLRGLADSLRGEREMTSVNFVRDRAGELKRALYVSALDRTRVNTLMRQLFSSVTVDYEGHDLAFQWRHGGQSEIELGS